MPLRKSSTSLGISSPSITLKPHRSYDSNRLWDQRAPPTSGMAHTNLILALVNRLKNKLPCNSGLPLDRVEADKPTQQAIEALIELSQDSIDVIAWHLADILHMLTKKQVDINGLPTIEVLQSQLFILKVLSATLSSRWGLKSTSQPNDDAASVPSSTRSPSSGRLLSSIEPPPLNDHGAKYILLVMVLFLRQTSNVDPPTMMANRSADIAFRDYECDLQGFTDPLYGIGDQISVESSRDFRDAMVDLPIVNANYEKTNFTLTKLPTSLVHLVAEYAGRIVFHVSASNWDLVLDRIREKIRHEDENTDLLPIQLLAHSALNRQRLVQVLNELSSLLINMGKEAQKAVAVALRAAIWHWIDYFPAEFNDAIRTRGRTEGAPERVFDLIHSLNQSSNEKIFWPTLTTLCCITSERITAEFVLQPYNTKPTRKENRFGVDMLRHLGSLSKFAEVSLVCAADICRAAVYVNPDEEAPLRLLALDVVHEIRAGFSSAAYHRAFNESHDEIDVPLYAEAMAALYRFLPPEDSLPLFSFLLRPEKADAIKTLAVKACLTLVQEANRIEWQRPLDKLYEAIGGRLGDIFRSATLSRFEVDEYGNRKPQDCYPKAQIVVTTNLSDKEMLLLGILALWRADPQFYISSLQEGGAGTRSDIAVKVWESNVDLSVKISAASTYRALTAAAFQMPGHPAQGRLLEVFKTLLPLSLSSVANKLITSRADSENQRMWISVAFQIMELYAQKSDFPPVKEFQNDPGRLSAFAMVEIAFIISLTSAESTISQLSAKGLRLIAYLERQPSFPKTTSPDVQHRLAIYDRLGDPKIMVIGRVGHQKRIRKLLRSIVFPPDVHATIWSECFWRWRDLTEAIYDQLNDFTSSLDGRRGSYAPSPLQDTRFQWQNLTLFLAAILGSSTSEPPGYTKLVTAIPRTCLPDSIRIMDDHVPLIDAFLSELTDLLVAPDAQIRDTAKDALGAELGPKLYGKVSKYLEETLRCVERAAHEETIQTFLPKLDQIVSVLKLLLENSHGKSQESPRVDVGPTLHILASLISRFLGYEASRTKTKFCAVCEIACNTQESLVLRKNTNNRHLILDIIMEWVQPTTEGDQTSLQCDLNTACLRTAVKLLEQLQLQPDDGDSAGEDGVHVVSRLFNRYSGALLHGLDTYYIDDMANDDSSDTASGHTNPQNLRAIQKEAQTRELVITGLTHLVSANPDNGLRQCLSLAFDKDKKKRAIFAHVFTRVIRKGIKFEALNKPETQAKRSGLCELVRGSNMVLASIICEVCPPADVDIMISVLLNLFDNRASLMKLMAVMIDQEIERTENEASLFRSNSTCTKFLSAFARIHGFSYLRSLIQPLIKSMLSMPPGCSYELDPSKAGDQDLEQNKKNVELIASSFLSIIGASVPALPAMFREICAHIAQRVAEHWPDSKFPALGSFIFLRFISPAVVTPEIVEVELPKDENTIVIRRGLMVIAKILQNLANNIFFGKELYMVLLNKFLEENIANVTRFLSEIIVKNPETHDDNDQWLGNTSDDTDDIVLHRFFVKHADKIGRELLSRSKPSHDGALETGNGKKAWDELCTLLVDLKVPFEAPCPSTLTSDSHEGYKQLMTRYARRDNQSVKELFSETGVSPPEPAYFIIRLSKIEVESLDIELLMYHIFKTLSTYNDRPFELILDCTSFTTASEIPLQWVNYCAELIPMDIRMRLIKTHILNPNYQAQKYLRRLYNVAAGASFCGEIRTYSSVDMLRQQVPEQALVPLAYADSLEKEPCQSFNDIVRKIGYMRMPVNVEVGTSYLRITSVGKTSISPGLLCNSTEIIPLIDVSDVYNVSTGQDLNEFIIRRSRQPMTMYFASPARDGIVKTIRSTKGRLKELPVRISDRSSRNSNVPAILLHVAFLSLDFDDDQLRAAAYDLLGAVYSYLGLEKNPIISYHTGFVPGNYAAFVEQLSERLADLTPSMTLDFLTEVAESMNTTGHIGTAERIRCLSYIRPWIKKLSLFANATSQLYERSGARLRDCIRTLAQLSICYPEIGPLIHKCIWNEIAKLDNFIIDVVLDELVRMAVDGGIGSARCEVVANILACLSSISVRAKIYSRLRKTLGKVSPKPSITLVQHTHWSEISTLLRLALAVSPQSKHLSHNQFHVPELVHLTTLVAGVGQISVRKSVYGVVMNLLQSLYISRSDDIPAEELLQLMKECTKPAKLRLFGLLRDTPSSDYGIVDPINDKDFLDSLEGLTHLLSKIMVMASGSPGLLNVWRARWMSLITSTAFQLSPAVQIRSFIAMGTLAVNDVDDDMLYQLLVALRNALFKANESQTLPIVSMLRCLCKMVPALPQESRYLVQLFWLAVALLQSSYMAFFNEATCLLRISLEKMEKDKLFGSAPVHDILLDGRRPLLDVTCQLDDILKLSFETSFSFSLAAIIFKGVRHSGLRDSAEAALRSLLDVTIRSRPADQRNAAFSDALGYFLALLPLSTSSVTYRHLLEECQVENALLPQQDTADDEEDNRAPRVCLALLGLTDTTKALLVTSFVGAMLMTAQGDDAETESLYTLLCDIAVTYPDIVALIYDNLQDKIKDTFANSSNASIIKNVSHIFTIALQEKSRSGLRDSSSTLGFATEESWRKRQASALEELGMQGLANSFTFLPRDRGHATKMINWIPLLIERIIG